RTRELQAAQAPVDQQVKKLTETLAFETKRREAVERMAVDAFKLRRELEAKLQKQQEAEKAVHQQIAEAARAKKRTAWEAKLAENKQSQAQLQQEIDESQKQLQAQQDNFQAEQSKLDAQAEALRAGEPDLGQKVQRLLETLAEETRLRQGAEQQVSAG